MARRQWFLTPLYIKRNLDDSASSRMCVHELDDLNLYRMASIDIQSLSAGLSILYAA